MADPLDEFTASLAANDIYSQMAKPIMGARFNTSSWTPGQTIAATAAQSFLGEALNLFGQRQEADQMAKVSEVMPSLYSNPLAVSAPEGVDPQAFGELKLGMQRERGKIQQSMVSEIAKDLFSKRPDLAMSALGMSQPQGNGVTEAVRPHTPGIEDALANGGETPTQKLIRLTKEQMDADPRLSVTQAQMSARKLMEGEIDSNKDSYQKVDEARKYGRQLLDMANTAKSGIGQAGDTGEWYSALSRGYDAIMAGFGNQESIDRRTGRTVLGSLAPEIVKMSRSPGAVSDYETKLYLGSGPSLANTPQSNAVLAQKMEDLGHLHLDYANFLEAYRAANNGSVAGADSKWQDYRSAYPVFTSDNSGAVALNPNRPSWQEYFIQAGSGGAPQVTRVINGATYVKVDGGWKRR